MENWSVPNNRYHKPIKGKILRNLLCKHGFDACLINEYATSRHCPRCCQLSLQTFKQVENPRPYRRTQIPTRTRHSLLRCTNLNCLENMDGSEVMHRLWNRDLAAVLNFRHILNQVSHDDTISERFTRVIQIGLNRIQAE
ncbi:hypothetical protein PHYBLDRAFT_170217 [Phycomyces blakesleeanus NRRL 1555(-)]|uniref:Uncharacterized protein n=1 Tax=Phycomyces blakesleeanus (strain ATCC 8743b / DSM 1359 / FGSC 10004 / NBRC 33097 / NRRL 1555) TaxID=763407 RepID=A0A167M260_PHYB8|nr:hypothetical protein PHYBLDRAFT_170217 [Phycomyces blakesleeanus NRRL 1555(-)]OAD71557.1 hypothetical protein PHYBLDRAFT_170217 [Phycomyces blakesleeanus NRRL 1555(-)]|eukprot:XP_018289597.1 hypothetical protein PHYBLDRAFT_170217 [Phycomyces blakesleeanus NRRL 1555(-)]